MLSDARRAEIQARIDDNTMYEGGAVAEGIAEELLGCCEDYQATVEALTRQRDALKAVLIASIAEHDYDANENKLTWHPMDWHRHRATAEVDRILQRAAEQGGG